MLNSEWMNDIVLMRVRNYDNVVILLSLSEDAIYEPERVRLICMNDVVKYEEDQKVLATAPKANIIHLVYK